MQWLRDALSNMQHAANEEARRRLPTNSNDREIRWKIIARPVLENDDPAEIASFARDLREYAKQQGAGEPTDPVLALIAESHRAEEAANEWHAAQEKTTEPDGSGHEAVLFKRQNAARSTVLSTMPTTREGLKAFTDFVGSQASLTYGSEWRAKVSQEMGGDLLVALCAAVETVPEA